MSVLLKNLWNSLPRAFYCTQKCEKSKVILRTRTLASSSVLLKNVWNPGREFHHFCEFPPTSQQAAAREYISENLRKISRNNLRHNPERWLYWESRIENSTISVNSPQQASKQLHIESISENLRKISRNNFRHNPERWLYWESRIENSTISVNSPQQASKQLHIESISENLRKISRNNFCHNPERWLYWDTSPERNKSQQRKDLTTILTIWRRSDSRWERPY